MNELTLLWVPGTAIGYARLGTYLAAGLEERGVDVYSGIDNPGPVSKAEVRDAHPGRDRRVAESPTNAMCMVSVPTHLFGTWEGQHRSMFTMWEGTNLPEGFRESFHELNTIIVPSYQNVELFSEWHLDVQLCFLGVDPKRWHYVPPPDPSPFFNFLISGRGARKGVDLAFDAFTTVFKKPPKGGPVPRLWMKSHRGQVTYFSENVEHLIGEMTDDDETALYQAAHCYVQPSRGEGFGLQPLQAIATGRPTILTNAHGHESFANLGIPLSWTLKPSEYFVFGSAGDWWEPDFDELCEAMWDVYNNYDTHAARAKRSAQEVAEHWTWANTTDRFIEILGDEFTKPYTGSGEWKPLKPHLFHIVTNRDWFGNIAGRQLFFEAGKDYWDVADVKRIFFDAGVLAPECLQTADHGLAPEQVEHIDAYNASKSFCPTCNQQLNTQPTASDLLEIAWANADASNVS